MYNIINTDITEALRRLTDGESSNGTAFAISLPVEFDLSPVLAHFNGVELRPLGDYGKILRHFDTEIIVIEKIPHPEDLACELDHYPACRNRVFLVLSNHRIKLERLKVDFTLRHIPMYSLTVPFFKPGNEYASFLQYNSRGGESNDWIRVLCFDVIKDLLVKTISALFGF